ncbi:MAG TPA: YlxR family protein [Candidatus Bathyarchaeia archaeon]|nr:YlxR family protein [Candidatus Bathyarchaeia archaeon]
MKKVSQRTCVGCLVKQKKEKLARLVVKKDQVILDPSGKAQGRGAYLCKSREGVKKACLNRAYQNKTFKKTFKKDLEIESLFKKHGQEKEKSSCQKKSPSPLAASGGGSRPRRPRKNHLA